MSYNSFPYQGGPTAAPPNMNTNFNQMLQRSLQGPPVSEAPSKVSQDMGFGGPRNASPMPPAGPNVFGASRDSVPQPILPVDLPPQAFLTSSMLLDMVDKKVDVLLRDEKEYIGILRSYDQFANLVLTECYERIAARNPDASHSDAAQPPWLVCDVKLPGLMTVRGENVTICATVDLDREDEPRGIKFSSEKDVRALAAVQRAEKKEVDSKRAKALKQAGIEPGIGMQA